ncbi:MAG: serine/threonine protein kinase [Myxococcales bacterium]|nr:serine/threonine protein kinase [Myxococcales bacterium]
MGEVWLGERPTTVGAAKLVAVKLLRRRHAGAEALQAMFLQEARLSMSLTHSNIVQVFDYGVHEGMPYLVMELLAGQTLEQRLQVAGRLDPQQTLAVMEDVCAAVSRAHEAEVIHRDLKPANIFLVNSLVGGGEREHVKVLDFGIAKFLGGAAELQLAETQTGTVLGTPYYMSPEQLLSSKTVDHRADLWSLGVIVYECLTGSRPFESRSLAELCVMITTADLDLERVLGPRGLSTWLRKALAREPDERFSSAMEMLEGLRSVVAGEGFYDASGKREAPREAVFDMGTDIGPDLSLKLPVERTAPASGSHAGAGAGAGAGSVSGSRASPAPLPERSALRSPVTIVVGLAVVGVLGLSAYLAMEDRDKATVAADGDTPTPSTGEGPAAETTGAEEAAPKEVLGTGYGDPCKQAADCGWDDPCMPTRCVGAEQAKQGADAACEESGPAPGECLCVSDHCVLRPSAPPESNASCESGACGVDQAGGSCIAGGMKEANEHAEEGPLCSCNPQTRLCEWKWIEPIPCRNTSQCWISAGPPFHPVARPKNKRGAEISPCRDAPVAPTCRDGHCGLISYGCD